MAIFRVQFINTIGAEQTRLVEADWQADVEREIQAKGYQLVAIEHISTVSQNSLGRRSGKRGSGFWTFRKFVTPSWICAVFTTNVVLVVLIGCVLVFMDINAMLTHQTGRYQIGYRWHVLSIVGTLVVSLLYLFSLRIALECVIVLFRIYDELVESKRLLGNLAKK